MKRFKNILYVHSGEADQNCALARALALARSNEARLTALAVVEALPAGTMLRGMDLTRDTLQQAVVEQAERGLRGLLGAAGAADGVDIKVATGAPFLEAIRDVLCDGRDLVIKCAGELPGFAGRLLGSDDMHLLRKCPCPVWLCKPNAGGRYRRILVSVDAEQLYPPDELETRHDLNLRLLALAAALARTDAAELHVAYAWSAIAEGVMRSSSLWAPEERIDAYIASERQRHAQALASLLAELEAVMRDRGEPLLEPIRHLPRGSARTEIPALARRIDADLLVLGTLGRTGVPGFFIGNTAETVLYQVDCSVLALKPDGFVSPVTC